MFRPMRRFKQQITDAECKEILKNEKRGVLSLLGDDVVTEGKIQMSGRNLSAQVRKK